MERRRREEPDDTAEIKDQDLLKKMHADWFGDFYAYEMTDEQKKKKHSSQTSMFNAYLWQHFGGKGFVMAVWQTGISWAPTKRTWETNRDYALEHVAVNFGKWAQRIIRA